MFTHDVLENTIVSYSQVKIVQYKIRKIKYISKM
jgi:hypothetical protein